MYPRILVIGALALEVEKLHSHLKNLKSVQVKGLKWDVGLYVNAHRKVLVNVAHVGIGKSSATLITQNLITAIKPQVVIVVGTCGSSSHEVGSICVPKGAAFRDVDPIFGDTKVKYFEMYLTSMLLGTANEISNSVSQDIMYTGDSFVREPLAGMEFYDMESASIAKTCIFNRIPCACVRVVSDTLNHSAYRSNRDECHQKGVDVVVKFIDKIATGCIRLHHSH